MFDSDTNSVPCTGATRYAPGTGAAHCFPGTGAAHVFLGTRPDQFSGTRNIQKMIKNSIFAFSP